MRKLVLSILAIGLLAHLPASAQFPASYASRLQFVLDSVSALYNIKGVSAAVTVPGLGTWSGVHGISHDGVPMDASMALGIGSNTKTFIASTILKLEEQNLISLDDTIGTWIQHPHVPGTITVKQLLNHTSGIFSYTESSVWGDSAAADLSRIWQPEEILQFLEAPYFPAGTNWYYSNGNYLLLGLIIKQITGQNLSTVLRNEILTPAGLTHTWLIPEETPTTAIPHIWSSAFHFTLDLEDLDATYNYSHNSLMSMAWAAGAIVSTAADNATFWSKLITGQIISPAALIRMKEMIPLTSTAGYGLGIFRYKNFNGRTIYTHGGTNIGFINENLADSISGVGISVLTNQDSIDNNILLGKLVAALHKVTINPPTHIVATTAPSLQMAVYPNPATDRISITGLNEHGFSQVQLYDMAGRKVLQLLSKELQDLPLPTLPAGQYLLRVSGEEGTATSLLTIHR